jgi:hypothetical protein
MAIFNSYVKLPEGKSPGQIKFLLLHTGQDTACVAQGLLAGAQEPFFHRATMLLSQMIFNKSQGML